MGGNSASTQSGEEGQTMSKNIKNNKKYFTSGEDHVLNVNLHIRLVRTFIFTDIQRVKTWVRNKSNGVCLLKQGYLVTVGFAILFVPMTAVQWPFHGKFITSLTNIQFMTYDTSPYIIKYHGLRMSNFGSVGTFYLFHQLWNIQHHGFVMFSMATIKCIALTRLWNTFDLLLCLV